MAPRRIDPARFDPDGAGDPDGSVFGLPYGEPECSVVMLAVPWEPTTSYGSGTAAGPEAIRAASAQLDLYDPELAEVGLGRPWLFGLHMRAIDPDIAAWNEEACAAARAPARDRERVDALSAKMVSRVRDQVLELLAAGQIPGVVGGDHSVAHGSITAAAHGGPLGVLHVDAHADLRVAYEGYEHSHASVMWNVLRDCPSVQALVQIGVRDLSAAEAAMARDDGRVHCLLEHSLRARIDAGESFASVCAEQLQPLPSRVWISFDIDGLEPALCPGTGTPVPGGLRFWEAMSLLRAVAVSGREIVGFDLVEVAPSPGGSEWDGNVGARILHRLCGAALRSQGAVDDLRS